LRPAPGLIVERRAGRCVLEHPATPCVRRPVSPALAEAVERLPGTLDDPGLWEEMAALVKLGYVELED